MMTYSKEYTNYWQNSVMKTHKSIQEAFRPVAYTIPLYTRPRPIVTATAFGCLECLQLHDAYTTRRCKHSLSETINGRRCMVCLYVRAIWYAVTVFLQSNRRIEHKMCRNARRNRCAYSGVSATTRTQPLRLMVPMGRATQFGCWSQDNAEQKY